MYFKNICIILGDTKFVNKLFKKTDILLLGYKCVRNYDISRWKTN